MGTREVPASVGQRLLWLMDHYRGADGGLNEPLVWRLRGALDLPALTAALDALSVRHEALRTTYVARRSRLTQIIHDPCPMPFAVVDLSHESDPEARMMDAIEAELFRNVDPTDWPVRATLWRVAADDHLLCVNLHHLAVDYRSNGIISANLAHFYNQRASALAPMAPVARQYADWSRWQAEALAGDAVRELSTFWLETLDGARFLPVRPDDDGVRMDGQASTYIRGERLEHVRAIAQAHAVPMFAVLLAAVFTCIYRMTGMTDMTVGSLVDGRGGPEFAGTVGFFENLVLIRGRIEPDAPFADLVDRTGTVLADALAHAALPFHMLPPGVTGGARSAGDGRADDVVVNLIDAWDEWITLDGVDVQLMPMGFDHSDGRFGVRVMMMELPDGLVVYATYGLDGPAPAWVSGLAPAFDDLMSELVAAGSIATGPIGS